MSSPGDGLGSAADATPDAHDAAWPEIAALGRLADLFHHNQDALSEALGPGKGPAAVSYVEALVDLLGQREREYRDAARELATTIHHVQEILTIQRQLTRGGSRLPRETLRLHDLVYDALSIAARGLAQQGIRIEVAVPLDLPAVSGDRTRLIQVLVNVLKNAGESFAGAPEPVPAPAVSIHARTVAAGVRLRIRDNGPGFAPERAAWSSARCATSTPLPCEHCGQALENARLHQALLAREKLSAVGQALSMVVHDLRSPIGIIVNSAELAKEEPGVPPHVDTLLDMIVSATDSAMAIVNDVLDFTRDLRLNKSSCRVDSLLEPLRAHLAERLAETGVRLALDAPPQLDLVCDPRKMHRALINLVNNAIDALTAARTPDPAVSVDVSAAGRAVLFRVADNGPGIPGAIRDRVLEPFVTADKPTGTGLGLAIVRQIAEAHGGGVEVETSSRGTTVTMRIHAGDA